MSGNLTSPPSQHHFHWLWRCLVLVLGMLGMTFAHAQICVLSQDSVRPYREFVEVLRQQQRLQNYDLEEIDRVSAEHCGMMISIGGAAAAQLADWPQPVIHTLLSQEQYLALYPDGHDYPRSAVFTDQPLERYVALIRLALPNRRHVLLLNSERTRPLLNELYKQLAATGLQLDSVPFSAGQKIDGILAEFARPDSVLLVVPDSNVLNSETAQPFIMSTYQRGIPLVGYSQNLVRAGGLMAVHASLADQAADTRELLAAWQAESQLPPADFGDHYSVAVNYRLARALYLNLPTEAALLRAIQQELTR